MCDTAGTLRLAAGERGEGEGGREERELEMERRVQRPYCFLFHFCLNELCTVG